jgi:hypothetical protein
MSLRGLSTLIENAGTAGPEASSFFYNPVPGTCDPILSVQKFEA